MENIIALYNLFGFTPLRIKTVLSFSLKFVMLCVYINIRVVVHHSQILDYSQGLGIYKQEN